MRVGPPPSATGGRSLLWVLSLPLGPNGATFRYLNFSRWLRHAGFSVHFAVSNPDHDELRRLMEGGWIDGFSELRPYRATGVRNAFSRLLIFPSLRNRFMAREQAAPKEEILALVGRYKASACIISNRDYLICLPDLAQVTRVVIDWCDSYALFYGRSVLRSIRSGGWSEIPGGLYGMVISFLAERYYPRLAHASLVVSQRDQRVFHRLCPAAGDLRIVPNGIESAGQSGSRARIEDRLVFSGRMDFPPNYEGAVWFIDRVLPLVRKRRPGVHLVIAGANPAHALKARQSEAVRVTGWVPDMIEELSQASLYVAPLVSGGGFKNKVLESMVAGTPIVGTPLAAEFLPAELRQAVIVAINENDFADAVIRCLEHPELLAAEIEKAQQFLRLHFTWQARTADLLALLDGGSSD